MPRQKSTRNGLPELPVRTAVAALRSALLRGHAVLTAEPGSGKTTLIPLLLLDEQWLTGRSILMLEPRRPAARMAARRMAQLLGEEVGGTVGYQVRFERKISESTRIEVLTEGLLLRRLQNDPELGGVGLLIFDEFHERSLVGDLSLALGLDVAAGLREDLRLLVMSATLDAQPLADLLQAPVVTALGRQHPVDVIHMPQDADPRDPTPACLRALGQALECSNGDVLVFLPGRREIERMRQAVETQSGAGLDVLTLFGDMPAAAQDVVLRGGGGVRRRVILATDIAETSLTIEGVQAVVDSGLARRPVFDPNTGLTRLQTQWISRASAQQRAGRAGRLGPGQCLRVWTPARHARLAEWTSPEITEADLAGLVLELANWGVTDPGQLRWLDLPPPAHWQQAVGLLRQLGALDAEARITKTGRGMARFPAHPRLAHVLVSAVGRQDQAVAAEVVALLSERDPLGRTPMQQRSADITLRIDALAALGGHAQLPSGFDATALRRIEQAARQFRQLCPAAPDENGPVLDAARCLALAYPDRVAMAASTDGRRYLMRNGRAALLDETDPLRGSPFLAIAAVDAGMREGVVWLAAALDLAQFESLFGAQIIAGREVRWDERQGDVVARSVRRLDALVLSDTAVALHPDDPVAALLFAQIREQGLAAFFSDSIDLRARVQLLAQVDKAGGWPDFTEQGILANLETWLLPWMKRGEGARQLRALRLDEVLLGVLGWERAQRLDQLLPTHFDTAAGTRRRIEYREDALPLLALPLQEMLGCSDGPVLAGGRVRVLLHLLSPAGRPLQVTSDLAAFWAGAYAEVKKEMRGRYPKHFWPDDPAAARATRFTKRRM